MSKVIVLNSGGFDSVVLMHYLYNLGLDLISLYFNYGQRNANMEELCAKEVARKLDAEFIKIDLPKFTWSKSLLYDESSGDKDDLDQYLEMRNLIFISYALSLAETRGIREIYTAFIHPEGNYYRDTSPKFLELLNSLTVQTNNVEIKSPFHQIPKMFLTYYARIYQIREDDFFSCNMPNANLPCGKCSDCLSIKDIYEQISYYKVVDIYLDNDFKVSPKFKQAYLNTKITNAKLFINNSCQFSCSHCMYGFKEMVGNEMSDIEVKDLVDNLVSLGVKYIDFGGKEPLFDTRIFLFLDYIKFRYPRVRYSLITNGVNVNKYLRHLVKYKPQVTLSVESLDNLKYRPNDGGLIPNIINLTSAGVPVSISIDLYSTNKDEIKDIIEVLYEVGVRNFYVKPIIEIGLNASNVTENKVDAKDIMQVLRDMNEIAEKEEYIEMVFDLKMQHIALLEGDPLFDNFITNYVNFRYNRYGAVKIDLELFCDRFLNTIAITPDGYVLGCGYELSSSNYSKVSIGNLKDTDLLDLIKEGKNHALGIMSNSHKKGCFF